MSDRYHCINGVWTHDDRCGKGRDFTADEVVSVYAEHDLEYGTNHVTVLLKDDTKIVPDYTGWGTWDVAVKEAEFWYEAILGSDKSKDTIKPIETIYKGYRFRSRLEARWAVFWDAVGIEWEYEPEGFDLGDGILYLPDFYLPDVGTRLNHKNGLWVEVKGVMTPKDEEKIIRFSGFKEGEETGQMEHPIYVVGNIPVGNSFWGLIDDMGKFSYQGRVPLYNFEYVDGDYYGAYLCVTKNEKLALLGDDCNYLWNADQKKTEAAYNAARQARFEHGEHGYTNNNN